MADDDLRITLDYNNCMADAVGKEHGLAEADFDGIAAQAGEVGRLIAEQRNAGKLPYLDLPYKAHEAAKVREYAKAHAGEFDDVVVLGIGGSALGTIAVHAARKGLTYNLLPRDVRGGPRLFVVDNVDPAHVAAVLDLVDLRRALVVVISKSGETAETMAQFLICRDLLRAQLGADYVRHVVIITDRKEGSLRPVAKRELFEPFDVPDGVGGRFSVLSAVGLLPLAMVGVDIDRLLQGAAAMDQRCRETDFRRNPAFMSGAIQYLYYLKGKPLSVMMPYSQALRDVADWYRQLWAESLGKKRPDGAFVGPTPIKALGVTDQHSQVQLYREGPADKVFTILSVEAFGAPLALPNPPDDLKALDYLGGHTMQQLLDAEQRATVWALSALSNRPTTRIVLPDVTPQTVGALLQMLMIQTSIAGKMLGINTYNQPGVEAGKEATRALMGMTGPIADPVAKGLPAEATTYEALRSLIEKSNG